MFCLPGIARFKTGGDAIMTTQKHKNKHKLILEHRQTYYEQALDRLISGKGKPGDVTLRYNKLKAVK